MWPPSLEVLPLGEVVPGRAAAVLWSDRALGDVLVLSVYGVAAAGLDGNRALWGSLATYLARAGKPFILGGGL